MVLSPSVAILGAGSWGTAVAIHLAKAAIPVLLWARNQSHVEAMQRDRRNTRYLPQHFFPSLLQPTADLKECLTKATSVIIAVPSHAFADLLRLLPTTLTGLAWLTKGLDPKQHAPLSTLVQKRFGLHYPIVVISGPSFAKEVASGLPTALVLAGPQSSYLGQIRHLLHRENLRVYLSEDTIGVQLCGAVKNVLAIACGISDGLDYGANAKAALITRGLAEMKRLGIIMGAQETTFLGLAGVGDLVLTCTDDQSRNRRFGLQIGQGIAPGMAHKTIGQVVEGKANVAQICALAMQYGIEMPICNVVNAVLQEKLSPNDAVIQLMSRPPKDEY